MAHLGLVVQFLLRRFKNVRKCKSHAGYFRRTDRSPAPIFSAVGAAQALLSGFGESRLPAFNLRIRECRLRKANFKVRMAFVVLTAIFSVGAAQAQSPTNLTGVYEGTYECASGTINLKLAIVASDDGSARGRFTFSQPQASGGASGSFNLRGHYDASTGKFKLDPQNWNPPVPPGFPLLGVEGSLDVHTNKISGNLTGACTTFQATRNEAESAALPKAPPQPPRVGGNSATPTTRPTPNQSKPQN